MSIPLLVVIASSLFIAIGNSYANDSIARVSTGSIVLINNEQIRMTQEVLEISTKSIRVKYRFKNDAATDIKATVAFPMPEYGWNPGESSLDANIRPLDSFRLFVDGTLIPAQLSRRAVVDKRDITEQLRNIGLTDTQIFNSFGDCSLNGAGNIQCALTKEQATQLDSRGIMGWQVAETAYWEQVFPAGKELEVRHEYAPFVGRSYTAPYQQGFGYVGDIPISAKQDTSVTHDEACLNDGTHQTLTKKIRSLVEAGAKMVWVELNDVEYILGTGRNWKGPIGDFKLRIEKTSPDQFISLCFPGKPKKLRPLILEFSQTDYVPQDRLVVHFYTIKAEMN